MVDFLCVPGRQRQIGMPSRTRRGAPLAGAPRFGLTKKKSSEPCGGFAAEVARLSKRPRVWGEASPNDGAIDEEMKPRRHIAFFRL
jgi:hypothetical protein